MISALEFLNDVRLTGLFALSPEQTDKLKSYADALDFAFLQTDLTAKTNLPTQLEKIGEDLSFPSWYGANLDALHDCLTDLSWQPARGYLILIRGMEEALTSDESSNFREVMISIIEFWQAQETPFWVFFEAQSPLAKLNLQKINV